MRARPFEPELQIDAIQQGPGESLPVAPSLAFGATAAMSAVAMPAAGTGIGRGHQGDRAREAGSAARGAEPDLALFQRLAELVQNGPGKFGHFIEKHLNTDMTGKSGIHTA